MSRVWHKVNFLADFDRLEFRVLFSSTSCYTKVKEHSLSYYLCIAGGRIIGFIPFPKVFVQCEIQTASSRFRTWVAMSIPYDDNHYTKSTSMYVFMCVTITIGKMDHYRKIFCREINLKNTLTARITQFLL